MGLTKEQAEAIIAAQSAPDVQSAPTPAVAPQQPAAPPAAPSPQLQGQIEYTPGMQREAEIQTRAMFPQPGDNPVSAAMSTIGYPGAQAAQGFFEPLEALGNAGLSAIAPFTGGHPTVGGIMRQIPGMQNALTPIEFKNSQPYQQAMQDAGMPAQLGSGVFGTLGGLVSPNPLGRLAGPMSKIMPGNIGGLVSQAFNSGVKFAEHGGIPTAQIGNVVTQISQHAPEALAKLGYKPLIGGVKGAATGAAMAVPYAQGEHYTTTGQNLSPEAAQVAAGGGALFGGALGAVGSRVATKQLESGIQARANQSPLEHLPQDPRMAAYGQHKIFEEPKVIESKLARTNQLLLSGTTSKGKPLLPGSSERFYANAARGAQGDPEAQAVVNKMHAKYLEAKRKEQLQINNKQENRQYAEHRAAANKQDNRQYSEQKAARAEAKTGEHTDTSGDHYRALFGRIEQAESGHELRELVKDIHDPGHGPKGQRLLDSRQQTNLLRQVQHRSRYLRKRKSAETPAPGESEVGGGSEPETREASNNSIEAPNNEAKRVVEGQMRKTMDVPSFGKRTELFNLAVSVDKLAEAADWTPEESLAVRDWVEDLHEVSRELQLKKLEMNRLIDWAYKNEDKWQEPTLDTVASWANSNGSQAIALRAANKLGEFKNLVLRFKKEIYLENKAQQAMEKVRVKLWSKAWEQRGIEPTEAMIPASRPEVRTTLNGRATEYREHNGRLGANVIEAKPVTEFREPQNADELFSQAANLKSRINALEEQKLDIKNARVIKDDSLDGRITDDYNYLKDGRRLEDVMSSAFDKLKTEGDATPAVHVYHVDEHGYVSTTLFQQPKTHAPFPEQLAANEKNYERIYRGIVSATKEAIGKEAAAYDILTSTRTLKSAGGLEGLLVYPLVARVVSRIGKKALKVTELDKLLHALQVGTIDNIFKSNERFGGHEVSSILHNTIGDILDAFFLDKAGLLEHIGGADDQARLLNEFKAAKRISLGSYRQHAMNELRSKSAVPSQVEIDAAMKRANTAYMIRSTYERGREQLAPHIEMMAARKKDVRNHFIDPKNSKYYTADEFVPGKPGELRADAYDKAYHEALIKLDEALGLKAEKQNGLVALISEILGRKIMSIMAGNIRVFVKNAADQMPVTAAYFDRHLTGGLSLLSSKGDIKEAFNRLPIVTQADATVAKLEQQLAEMPTSTTMAQTVKKGYIQANKALVTGLDPLKGKSLASLPDHFWTRLAAASSMAKIASRYKIPVKTFVRDLSNGVYGKEERQKIFAEISEDIAKLTNAAAPHLNVDPYSTGILGRVFSTFSAPSRRNFRLHWDWLTSKDPTDQLRFTASFWSSVFLAGRGAVPASAQMALYAIGAIYGGTSVVEQGLQNFDNLNLVRQTAGVDLSNTFAGDAFNIAQPLPDALAKGATKTKKILSQSHGAADALWNLSAAELDQGMLVPKISTFGYDYWRSLFRNYQAGAVGSKVEYFSGPFSTEAIPVTVGGYDYWDAMRESFLPGPTPKAFEKEQQVRMNAAKNADALHRVLTNHR